MKIRKFIASDAADIREFYPLAIRQAHTGFYTRQEVDAWAEMKPLDKIAESLSKNICYVALDKEKVIGFGDLKREGEIRRLYINPLNQKQGIGTDILDVLKDEAVHLRLKKWTVHSALSAVNFYIKYGFESDTIEKVPVGRFLVDAVLMHQEI